MKKNWKWIAVSLVSICLIGAGYFLGRYTGLAHLRKGLVRTSEVEVQRESRLGGYKFISPLLECQPFDNPILASTIQLEKDLKSYISKVKQEGKASLVAVYYRDLNNGPWIGINQDEPFSPASLLKVPIMIAALKKVENDPSFLKKKFQYMKHTSNGTSPNIIDSLHIKEGNSYTLDQLILNMIAHSDNEAKNLILSNINDSEFIKACSDLGVNLPADGSTIDFMLIKNYSTFFRILYNATYLNKELSELALSYLSQSSYGSGLEAGLPKNVICAHKFGERGFSDSNLKQLHDCGIVYLGNKPYLICVMTRGAMSLS